MSDYALMLVEQERDFEGDFARTMDDKGRLVFPAAFRDEFADGLFVRPGRDGCLEIWTGEGHRHEKLTVLTLPMNNRDNRGHRALVTSARKLELDSQHRLTLPLDLRQDMDLDRDIVVKGNLDHVQVWSKGRYREWQHHARQAYADQDVPS